MANQPNPGQGREINLKTMAEQFIGGLQHHFDMLAFNLASREAATEEAYERHAQAPRIMPVALAHRNFEQMQAHARDLLFGQIVNDALNLSVNCMHNVHLFLSLVKARSEHGELSEEAQKEAQKRQQEFLQAPLDQKFNRLEEGYGIMCELEDTIVALGFAMQAIVQHGGIIQKPQLDEQQELKLELKEMSEGEVPADIWRQRDRLETVVKVFREGEKITFSDLELQKIILTVTAFAHQLFTAVFKYAQENQGA